MTATAPPTFDIPSATAAEAALRAAVARMAPLDQVAMAEAQRHLDSLTKPPGSLGRLESLAVDLAGITGTAAPTVDRRAVVVAAADHGVARRGVSAYPSDVTAQMVANFLAGGAAINVLAATIGADVVVLDVGVAHPIPGGTVGSAGARYVDARLRSGTADLSDGPAMTRDEAWQALGIGLTLTERLVADGIGLLGVGEMGIGNTTAASAVVAAMTGRPAVDVTGPGTGLDAAGRARKVAVIEAALARVVPDPDDPIGVLASVGGLEIGALTGLIVGGVAARVPVVLDGFITGAAALLAARLAPAIRPRLIAGHRSTEPGHAVALDALGLDPLLQLDLRLGEGSGAALAMGLVVAAARIRDEMATFASAGIAGPA